MNVVRLIISEVVGLFLDDAFMAIAILMLIAISAWLAFVVHASSIVIGSLLLGGCALVLVVSTMRGMRR